jgi:hypothetical protein
MIIKEEADVTVLNWMVIKPDKESNKMRQMVNLPDRCWLRYNLYPLFVPMHDVSSLFFFIIYTMLTD